MKTKKLIKRFLFEEPNRNRLTLGVNTRLNPEENVIQLKAVNNIYQTSPDLKVETWTTNPNSVRQWLGFECVVEHVEDYSGVEQTYVNFRLSDGTDEYYYNGAEWEVNVIDWNTEAEVADNISTFPVSEKKIRVIINLGTNDDTATPKVSAIKILYSADINHHEDYIYRSFKRQLSAAVRPVLDHVVKMTADSNKIDLDNDEYKFGTAYDVVSIDSVFNHTDDPDHWVDLYSSYNSSTHEITLNTTVSEDALVWIKLVYKPDVTVNESYEAKEVAKVPAITLNGIRYVNNRRLGEYDSVINKNNHTGVKLVDYRQSDITITLNLITNSSVDQARLTEEVKSYFDNNHFITSYGMDEQFSIILSEDFTQMSSSPMNGVHNGKLRCTIVGALFFGREAQDAFTVSRFLIEGANLNVAIESETGD